MEYRVISMPGDGIGSEVTTEGLKVINTVKEKIGLNVSIQEFEVGDSQFKKTGRYWSPEAESLCNDLVGEANVAILFGACTYEPIGILREKYDLFANLRPVKCLEPLVDCSPLKAQVVRGTDILIVRELTSGIYYGDKKNGWDESTGKWASQALYYNEHQIERVVRFAFDSAMKRNKQLTLAHKGNAIEMVFKLWLDVVYRIQDEYSLVQFEDLYVDNMAAQLLLRPTDFDVILAPNIFGDILSDLGGGIVGSLGTLPSASINANGLALYEPVSGTAPTLAGLNKANPMGSILSVAMMFRYSFGKPAVANSIEQSVHEVVKSLRTADVYEKPSATSLASCSEFGDAVCKELDNLLKQYNSQGEIC